MDKEIIESIKKFMDSFEQVFDKDWAYTQEQLEIHDYISPDGTFLNPKIADETEDWGHRAKLLTDYRELKKLLSSADI